MTVDPTAADVEFDQISSESEDLEASLHSFEIVTYPADYTLKVLVDKWERKQVKIPDFQRGYVWKQAQASKLIESFLIGLPVPAIFLYTDRADKNNQLVVDGQQRLRTVAYFMEGYFGEPNPSGRRQVFKLTGLHDKSPFLNKTYADLERDDPAAWNRLNDSVLRAFVIQQLDPSDDTSIYHVFERLNTGGTLLYPQEIRNAVAHGTFNDCLAELNSYEPWRAIYGSPMQDKRMRDRELILRVIALTEGLDGYAKPLKDFLNKFMSKNKNADEATLAQFANGFRRAVDIAGEIGEKPFRRGAGLNAAIFDSVMTAISTLSDEQVGSGEIAERYRALMADADYQSAITKSTTDDEVVNTRIRLARSYLSGGNG